MKLSRNFLIYDVEPNHFHINNFNNSFKKNPIESVEKFKYQKLKDDMYLITFKWIDKIKISDRYSKPIFNEVQSVYFESMGRIAVFCNSESNLHYFRKMIKKNQNINLRPIAYYDFWKNNFLNNKLDDEILGFDIRNPQLSDSDENLRRVSKENVKFDQLGYILLENEESIISIILSINDNMIYHIDPSSVISLSDNIDESKMYAIINLICKRYKS